MKRFFDNKGPGFSFSLYFVFRIISGIFVFRIISGIFDHSSIIDTLGFLGGRLLIIIIAVSGIKQKPRHIIGLIEFLVIIYLLWSILARFCGWYYPV